MKTVSDEYEEVFDFKKIAIVIGIIGIVVIIVIFFAGLFTSSLFNTDFPNPILDFPEFLPEIELPEMTQQQSIEDEWLNVKTNYQKFVDFGISVDDILDIQDMDCSSFENDSLISKDSKYTMIFEERRSEC